MQELRSGSVELRVSLGWAGRAEQALAELAQHGLALCVLPGIRAGGTVKSSASAMNSKGKNLVRQNNYIVFLDLYFYIHDTLM